MTVFAPIPKNSESMATAVTTACCASRKLDLIEPGSSRQVSGVLASMNNNNERRTVAVPRLNVAGLCFKSNSKMRILDLYRRRMFRLGSAGPGRRQSPASECNS
jgi:hypothetical protein